MNTYTVTSPTVGQQRIAAYDWAVTDGLVVFQDDIGRCLVAVAVEDGLRIDCEYADDELFDARRRLATVQRAVNLRHMTDEAARLTEAMESRDADGALG